MSRPESGERPETGWARWLVPAVTGAARYWDRHPGSSANGSRMAPSLELEHWDVVSDGRHNLTTDLTWWRGHFYLVHASSPWHIASARSRLVLWRSSDSRQWEKAAEFSMGRGDIRDPKLAIIGDRLFLYCLSNDGFVAEPGTTWFAVTGDGDRWSRLEPCGPEGWLFWRPKTDGRLWYVGAYWNRHGKSALLRSADGESWEMVSTIHDGDHNDETDVEFLPDGRLIATARLEMSSSILGHRGAGTLIASSEPPFERWTKTMSRVTRLDGPNLLRWGNRVFALGRRHCDPKGPFRRTGSCFGRKRTALYALHPDRLEHLTDLPSSGDTGYPGAVIRGEDLFVSYYTNAIDKDVHWLHGMFLPSAVRLAKVSLRELEGLSPLV